MPLSITQTAPRNRSASLSGKVNVKVEPAPDLILEYLHGPVLWHCRDLDPPGATAIV